MTLAVFPVELVLGGLLAVVLGGLLLAVLMLSRKLGREEGSRDPERDGMKRRRAAEEAFHEELTKSDREVVDDES